MKGGSYRWTVSASCLSERLDNFTKRLLRASQRKEDACHSFQTAEESCIDYTGNFSCKGEDITIAALTNPHLATGFTYVANSM
jgi:hypothetical protein